MGVFQCAPPVTRKPPLLGGTELRVVGEIKKQKQKAKQQNTKPKMKRLSTYVKCDRKQREVRI